MNLKEEFKIDDSLMRLYLNMTAKVEAHGLTD